MLTHLCIRLDGSSPEGRVGQLTLPAPEWPIAHKKPIACQAAAREECCAFLKAPSPIRLRPHVACHMPVASQDSIQSATHG